MMLIYLLVTLLQQAGEFSTSSEGRPYAPPEGPLYYLVRASALLSGLGVVIFAGSCFICPVGQYDDHIKRKILEDES